MAENRGFVAWDKASFHETDPASVWVVMGDPDRLPEWTGITEVLWSGELPGVDDELAMRAAGRHISAKVTDWEAGRRYRVELEGLKWVADAQLECAVESMVESDRAGAEVKIQFGATTARWRVPFARAAAQRRISSAMARLRQMVG